MTYAALLTALAISPGAIILLLLAAVVLFGRRLPEIGRYLSRGTLHDRLLGEQDRGPELEIHWGRLVQWFIAISLAVIGIALWLKPLLE